MNSKVFDIILVMVLVYCQINLYGLLVDSKFKLKKTLLLCNAFTTLLVSIYIVEVIMLGATRATNCMFITFTIPSLLGQRFISTHGGGRFLFMFFFCDFFIAAIEFIAELSAIYFGVGPYSVPLFWTQLCAMIVTTVVLVLFIRKPVKKIFAQENMKWGYMAAFSFALEVLLYFIGGYQVDDQNQKHYQILMLVVLCVLVFVNAIYVYNLYHFEEAIEKRMDAEKRAEQTKLTLSYLDKYYQAKHDNMDCIRRMKHDMEHHLRVLQSYVSDGRYAEADRYVKDICECLTDYELKDYCTCKIANVNIAWYAQICKQEEIDFSFEGYIPEISEEKYMYFTSIIANILQNALEACRIQNKKTDNYQLAQRPYIKLTGKVKGKALLVNCKNSFDGNIKEKAGELITRKDSKEHGIGIGTIRKAVEKFDGTMNYEISHNEFNMEIILMGM